MSVTEYCMDPDANLLFDEESLQTAIDMYNDRVVSEKHMVRKKLSPQPRQSISMETVFDIFCVDLPKIRQHYFGMC